MNKTTLQTGIVCFLFGLGCGFWGASEIRQIGLSKPVLTELTSQGRAEIRRMVAEINAVLDEDIGEVMAEKTKALQAITAKSPNRAAADFYISGAEDKTKKIQGKIDAIMFNAIERMPLIDRRAYMKAFLKNRFALKSYNVILPFGAERTVEAAEKAK